MAPKTNHDWGHADLLGGGRGRSLGSEEYVSKPRLALKSFTKSTISPLLDGARFRTRDRFETAPDWTAPVQLEGPKYVE